MLLVRQLLEAGEGGVEVLLGVEGDADLRQAALEGVTARVLAQDHAVLGPAHVLGAHDLVGLAVLENTVLVDAGLVGEGVGPDHRLVGLHGKAGDAGHQARAMDDLGGVDAGVAGEVVLTGAHRHDDLLQGGVAGAFPQAVDGALHLAGTIAYRGQGVGDGQAEVVVAVDGEDRLIGIGNALDEPTDEVAELVGHAVAHRIGDVDRARPGLDHRLQDPAEKIGLGTAGVFRGELNVIGVASRPFDGMHRLLHHLVRGHAQLALHVDGRGGDKGVNTRRLGPGEGLAGDVNILVQGPGQAADRAVLDSRRHGLDGLEVPRAGRGETGLDDIDPELFQGLGDAHLLLLGHGGPGALLAVPEGGIEDDEVLFAHDSLPRMRVTRQGPPGAAWRGIRYLTGCVF